MYLISFAGLDTRKTADCIPTCSCKRCLHADHFPEVLILAQVKCHRPGLESLLAQSMGQVKSDTLLLVLNLMFSVVEIMCKTF